MKIEVIVLALTAVVFLVLGIVIISGHPEVIHLYHREKVTDVKGYSRSMGILTILTAVPCAISTVVAYFSASAGITLLAFGIILAGMAVYLSVFAIIQKKYNSSVF